MKSAGHDIRTGTCSWAEKSLLESGEFYPKGVTSAEERLRYYAFRFDTERPRHAEDPPDVTSGFPSCRSPSISLLPLSGADFVSKREMPPADPDRPKNSRGSGV